MRHEAIYNLYSNVVSIDDGAGAFDADGNSVAINESVVAAEITRLQPIKATEQAQRNRKAAYTTESDPLFFMAQRGEVTEQEWLAKITEIKERFPKPE